MSQAVRTQAAADTICRGPAVPMDATTFCSIMAAFPTGVAVVTTRDADGAPRGFTSNAVTSVSLEPPLLLVCVAQTSDTLPVLRQAGRFGVNFLKSGAHDVSARFARKGSGKFAGLAFDTCDGIPVLHEHTVAHALCETDSEIEAGDHIVLIGRVIAGDSLSGTVQPLIYYQSRYPSWLDA